MSSGTSKGLMRTKFFISLCTFRSGSQCASRRGDLPCARPTHYARTSTGRVRVGGTDHSHCLLLCSVPGKGMYVRNQGRIREVSRGNDAPFGARLRRLREAAGLTQEELAERAGLRARGISDLERGARNRPYPHTVRSLADALELAENERSSLFAAVPKRGGAATWKGVGGFFCTPLPVPPP